AGDGNRTAYYQVRDAAFNNSNIVNDNILVDTASPTVDSLLLKDRVTGSTAFTNQLTVTLEALGVSADAVSMRIAQDASFTQNSTGWISYTATTEYTFTAGDGNRTAYLQVRDAAYNESNIVNDNILVDTASPMVDSILLRDRVTGSTVRTNQLTVTIEATNVSADAVSMRIAQDASFTQNSTGWISFTATTEYTFTAGDGNRTAYYQVRDLASNESNVVNDSILVDTASPTVDSILLRDRTTGSTTVTNQLTVTIEASNVSADAVSMRIAQDASFTQNSTGWISFTATTEYTFTAGDGTRTAYYQVRDAALNNSNIVNDSILVDTASPTVDSILLRDRVTGSTVRTNQLTVTIEASNVSADVVSMRIAQDASFTQNSTGWLTFQATTEYTFTAGDGLRTAYYQVRDAALNNSNIVNDNILVDTASPLVGSILLKDRTTGSLSYSSELTITLEAFGVSADAVSMVIAQDSGFTQNSTGWISYTATTEYTLTAGEGARTVYYKVRDLSSNESNVVNDGIIIDTISPEVDHITLFDRITGSPLYSLASLVSLEAFGVSADAVSMRIARDAGFTQGATGWIAYNPKYDFTLAAGEGTRDAYYQVRDAASNESLVRTAQIIVNFGPTAPTVLLKDRISGSSIFTKDQTITVETTVTEPDISWLRISSNNLFDGSGNDTGWVTYEASRLYTMTAGDGLRTIYVKVRDVASNESASGNDSINLDTTPPTAPNLVTPANNAYINNNLPTLIWNAAIDATSGIANYEVKIDGSIVATLGAVTNYAVTGALSDAAHTWQVRARDNAGNWGASSATWTFTVDTSLPAVSVIAPTAGELVSGTAYTVQYSATDVGGFGPTPITISLSLNGGANWTVIVSAIANSGTYNWTLPSIYSTNAVIKVDAIDLAGNTGSALSGTFTLGEPQMEAPIAFVKIDKESPKIFVSMSGVTLESGDYISKKPKFEILITDNVSVDQSFRKVVLNNTVLPTEVIQSSVKALKLSAESPIDLDDESLATHSLLVEAKDMSDNYAKKTIDNLRVATSGSVGVVGGKVTVFPMPFSSSVDKEFGLAYNLTKDAQVSIYLISGSGHQVITRLYLPGTNGGKAGFNQVRIEAVRDDTGTGLANGIYVIRVIGDYNPIGKAYLVVYN
ncbi:MAG: hypothetical protein WC529_09085, partial [Candidatus Margulisiibacteriota bacterium]